MFSLAIIKYWGMNNMYGYKKPKKKTKKKKGKK
jgi:hypothetical protein